MHEASISQALLAQLSSLSQRNSWTCLREVRVRVGLLSGVVPEALEFAFNAMAPGTPAAGARLVMESEPGRFSCATCGELDHGILDFCCPRCHGPLQLLRASRDLLLVSVETGDP